MRRIRESISSAHVIAIIALVVALGGTGYAALKLPRNSVGTSQLKASSVNSSKVKNGSLRVRDFKAGDLPAGAPGAQGAVGQEGARGPEGAQGPIGVQGPIGLQGLAGADGAPGTPGADGPTGADGARGPTGAAGVDGTAVAFARIDETGTLIGGPDESKGVAQANIQHDAGAGAPESTGDGVYCIGGLGFTPSSAIVTLDNTGSVPVPGSRIGGSLNFIASVAVFKGEDLNRCDSAHGQARVALEQVNESFAPTLADHGFIIWFQ